MTRWNVALPLFIVLVPAFCQGQPTNVLSDQNRAVTISRTTQKITQTDRALFSLQLQNRGTKDMLAYVLKMDTLDQDGKLLGSVCSLSMQGGNKPFPAAALTGEIQSQYVDKSGTLFHYVTTIDYAFFADGSGEGANLCKESEKIHTMWIAISM